VRCAKRGVSSASGNNASLSGLENRLRECSRRKNSTKVKTKQRLTVRVSGTTDMSFKMNETHLLVGVISDGK